MKDRQESRCIGSQYSGFFRPCEGMGMCGVQSTAEQCMCGGCGKGCGEMELPLGFTRRMEELLGEESEAFFASYERERPQGLRLNGWKTREGRQAGWEQAGAAQEAAWLRERAGFSLRPVPWVPEGYFYGEDCRPGRSPLHEAGVYYMQEPSAMAAGAVLDPQPGDRVLDLCAAPGGKSSHIASRLKGRGFLLSNEIHPARARILSQNMERMGFGNVVVSNHSPQELAERFPDFFDKIAVDAPCSGEGMFRKEEEALAQWSEELIHQCARRQLDILRAAASMLRPGGRLVYSTCTFAPEENEGTLAAFLAEHPDFCLEEREGAPGFVPARPEWAQYGREVTDSESGWESLHLERAFRLMPHSLSGEGHFIASLRRRTADGADGSRQERMDLLPGRGLPGNPPRYLDKRRKRELWNSFEAFLAETLRDPRELAERREYLLFGDQLYLAPPEMPDMDGLKILRPGLHMGTFKKNRFEPSHSLALWFLPEQVIRCRELSLDSKELPAYLRGEALAWGQEGSGAKGWVLIAAEGFSLGWCKLAAGTLKNHYPKGLRRP